MGYIPQKSLENLHKYSYKGVDKYVRAGALSITVISMHAETRFA